MLDGAAAATPTVSRAKPEHWHALRVIAASAGLEVDPKAEHDKPWSSLWIASRPGSEHAPEAYALSWLLGEDLELQSVATATEARRRGLARALLTALVEHARGHGARRLLLEVGSRNRPARALYEALGFVVTRTRPGYYADDDALEMSLDLTVPPSLRYEPGGPRERAPDGQAPEAVRS